MRYDVFLIKYAEIGIKGKNRYVFEDMLCHRMRSRLEPLGNFRVRREYGRILIDALSDYDFDLVTDRLTKMFGVTHVCPGISLEEKDIDKIKESVIGQIRDGYDDRSFSFKVRTKRIDKSFPIDSMQMNMLIGETLLNEFDAEGLHVDVHKPDVMVEIELRDKVYIYTRSIPGPGGLPVGTNGRGIALLSGGIDSPVAAYMIAKRGVEMEAVYFNAPPYTSERAKDKVKQLGTIVSQYAGPIKLYIVNFTDIQLAIYDKCPHDELTIIMKRFMYKIAEQLGLRDDCQCIVTGESVGQVSSQTSFSLKVINDAISELPVYRPLIGMDKQEIIDISQKIETFETSILPYEDCCTIFVDKHPVTKPKLEKILESEKALDGVIEPFLKKAMDEVEIIYLK